MCVCVCQAEKCAGKSQAKNEQGVFSEIKLKAKVRKVYAEWNRSIEA